MSFSGEILLFNLVFSGNFIILDNSYVLIIIAKYHDKYYLNNFYNKKKIKNAARCALYFLLQKLLESKKINLETDIFVKDIIPSDGGLKNTEAYKKLIGIYKSIGFNIESSGKIEDKNIILESNVSNLIEILQKQCYNSGGKIKKNKTKIKKSRKGNGYRKSKKYFTN